MRLILVSIEGLRLFGHRNMISHSLAPPPGCNSKSCHPISHVYSDEVVHTAFIIPVGAPIQLFIGKTSSDLSSHFTNQQKLSSLWQEVLDSKYLVQLMVRVLDRLLKYSRILLLLRHPPNCILENSIQPPFTEEIMSTEGTCIQPTLLKITSLMTELGKDTSESLMVRLFS